MHFNTRAGHFLLARKCCRLVRRLRERAGGTTRRGFHKSSSNFEGVPGTHTGLLVTLRAEKMFLPFQLPIAQLQALRKRMLYWRAVYNYRCVDVVTPASCGQRRTSSI